MPRKKVDGRIRTLIENSIKAHQRSLVVLVGDHGRDQVINLHYILSKSQVKARPSVLWCYKKDLGFSTHKQKRMKQIKKQMARGTYDSERGDPFELFVSSTSIRWCYYKETKSVLGQTYGMCVLQDFEALTPNILCRTIETVEGGGMVVLLLKTMKSLKQLYTLTMDVHARFRTEAHQDVVPRFNERFLLSLGGCESCIVLDDELNLLPLSRHCKMLEPLEHAPKDEAALELRQVKESLHDTEIVGDLVNVTVTSDQAKAVLGFIEAISDKHLRGTVSLTAGRGRGKSAALGLSVAAAVAHGYSNIYVTAPTPENLGTMFDFILKGLNAVGFREHMDYEAVSSSNPAFNNAVIRINIFRDHRQTVQYVQPQDAGRLSHAELVIVDEAAAIPLPQVRKLLGPHLVFLASTINGYEGTGRSLSLKLVKELRLQHAKSVTSAPPTSGVSSQAAVFREMELNEPIRYRAGDPVESWLNRLLCLDASTPHRIAGRLPSPEECDLYYIDRDALFSHHKLSETFLHRTMALYVASHYKNTPNDLQLLSDAPAHRLFVLLGPASEDSTLPDILCVIQLCFEGQIARESIRAAQQRGYRSSGDLIPWTMSQQFQDDEFPTLSGARIVRISTHPDAMNMGYGSRALQLLQLYFKGELTAADVPPTVAEPLSVVATADDNLQTEKLKPRKKLPPLLCAVKDRQPEQLDWIGVSFGLTPQLFKFWNRSGYVPLYVRQTVNEVTGEHTTVMVRYTDPVVTADKSWLQAFSFDFGRRLSAMLGNSFREFPASLALSMMDAVMKQQTELRTVAPASVPEARLSNVELSFLFLPHDLKRLESYARNIVDYHLVIDLVPKTAALFFGGRFGDLHLSRLQSCILLAVGLQGKTVDEVSAELSVPANQAMALFNKCIRKLSTALRNVNEAAVEAEDAGAEPDESPASEKMPALTNDELKGYEIKGSASAWNAALKGVSGPSKVSIATSKRKAVEVTEAAVEEEAPKKTPKSARKTKKAKRSAGK